jgi:serine/threonine protein kinase/type II secretory pathway predicted ATPase ExeA/tetratricopeptide (TPR) repeat protein
MSHEPDTPWPANPFSPGSPLNESWFAGRQSEIEMLASAIRDHYARLVIRGPRGMGKTTFVRSYAALKNSPIAMIDVRDYVDPRDVARPDAVVRTVVRALLEELPRHYTIPAHELADIGNEHQFGALLERLVDSGTTPVIAIDELDFAAPDAQLAITRLGLPRRGTSRGPLWIFIIGDTWGSAGGLTLPPGPMDEISLGLLDRDAVLNLLARFPERQLFAFEESAQDLVWSETAGHPFFLGAVLDALYEMRWRVDDRSPITRDDVRRAVEVIEQKPPARVVHAFRQAGPAALSVLKTLAEQGREALSTGDLREIFRIEWPSWAQEVGPALTALEAAALLRNERGIWSHRIPIVRGYVARLDRADVAGSEHPPRPDAWAAFREGEALQLNGQMAAAIEAFRKAVALDGEYWLARWHLAQLLVESAERSEDDDAIEKLKRAKVHLGHIVDEGVGGATRRFAVEVLCRTLLRLATALPEGDANRDHYLQELLERDEHLTTPGAADAVAETLAAKWATGTLRGNAATWPDRTRQWLRKNSHIGANRLRREATQWVVERLDSDHPEIDSMASTLDVVRFVVPVLLDEWSSADAALPLWNALCSWLRRNARTQSVANPPYFDPHAWDTLLRFAPVGVNVLDDLQAWLEHDFSSFFEKGAGEQVERLLKLVTDPQVVSAIGEAWTSRLAASFWKVIDDRFGSAIDAGAAMLERLLDPLGRALLVFKNTRHASAADINAVVSMYIDSVADIARLAASPAAVDAWKTLLAATNADSFLGKLERDLLPVSRDLADTERKTVERWLQNNWSVRERVPIRLQGYPADTLQDVVRAYHAIPVGGADTDAVMVRTFTLQIADSNVEGLMKAMWERERRAIATLSLTPGGRALLQYREHRQLDQDHVAILITEWPGSKTLRDTIRDEPTTIRGKQGQRTFWTHFVPLLEAIQTLHGGGFLHRAISPEAIYDRSADSSARQALTLAHFEWSVYLRRLDARGRHSRSRERKLNRYVAPEAIRAALRIADPRSGETFGSDLYALGLTLFECMVRPLDETTDLHEYRSDESYGPAQQKEHSDWLASLRTEVNKAVHLETFEQKLLLKLLQFDLEQRRHTLEAVIEEVRRQSILERSRFQNPLPVFTPLRCRDASGDPRKDFHNLAFFLRRELPEIDAADPASLSPAGLAQIVRNDLRGASVFVNSNSEFPLLLVSRTGTQYRLRPFRVEDRSETKLGYLETAHPYQGDDAWGDAIGVLDGGVDVLEAGTEESRLRRYLADLQGRGWRDLFEIAEDVAALVKKENDDRRSRQTLLDILAISNEVEYALAWKEAPFVIAKPGTALVRSPDDENLAATVAAWLARDLWIEVSRPRTPAGQGIEVSLTVDALDLESGVVDLTHPNLGTDKIPEDGVLRPTANRGLATIYRRRKEALRQLRDDTALLKVAITPGEGTIQLPERLVGHTEPFIPRLDQDKKKILQQYRRTRPCLVVQGPPGTGKTTLATEIILQTLHENPNARILVTAQGHAPLDNLLLRLIEERDRNPEAEKKLDEAELLRLTSGNRTDTEYPPAVQDFLPYERAERLFQALKRECEKKQTALGLQGKVATLIARALAPYAHAPTSLLRRIEDSATLVFVTTNARDVEEAEPGSFDVVIVEEAARCVPMELFGVMRLARHWLLIGDHHQLPPFGYELVMSEIDRRIDGLVDDVEQRINLFRSTVTGRNPHQLEREAERVQRLQQSASRYMNLFRHLHTNGDAAMTSTLRTQWRMHPTIGTMVSDVFYDSKSVVNPTDPGDYEGLVKRTTHQFREPPFLKDCQILWVDFDHMSVDRVCEERRGPAGQLENDAERRTAVGVLRQIRADRPSDDIALLTPYRSQMEQFRGLMSREENYFDAFGTIDDRIFTVDSFQGQQAGTVVLSLVRNNDAQHVRHAIGFLAEPQRATVMFSRAERLLVILGCAAQFKRFAETSWVVDIYSRAVVKPWTEFLTLQQRRKLDERRRYA